MFCFQSLLWKFSLKLCFRLLSTHFRLRLEPGRGDSGRSYQSKRPTALEATDHLGGLFIGCRSFRVPCMSETSFYARCVYQTLVLGAGFFFASSSNPRVPILD